MNDKEHEEINRQLMIACKQMKISHFVLPKFAKNELQQVFGVKRLTTFGLNFSGMEQYREKLTDKISEFNNNFEAKPDLIKFRYADDSMFNSSKFGHTLIKKWDVLVNQKNNKKKIRSKSAPKE